MKMSMTHKKETKTCLVFESADGITLYLKKTDITAAGIDPHKGVTITVEGDNNG